jgi:hypothetical protein
MFLNSLEKMGFANGFSKSKIWLRVLNKVVMIAVLFLFCFRQTLNNALLFISALVFHFMNSKIEVSKKGSNRVSQRAELNLPELKVLFIMKVQAVFFYVFQIGLFLSKKYVFEDFKTNVEGVALFKKLYCHFSMIWIHEEHIAFEMAFQTVFIVLLISLELLSKNLSVFYDDLSFKVFNVFFNLPTVAAVALAVVGLFVYREQTRQRFSLFDFMEVLVLNLFLVKSLGNAANQNWRFFKKGIGFFRGVCVVKVSLVLALTIMRTFCELLKQEDSPFAVSLNSLMSNFALKSRVRDRPDSQLVISTVTYICHLYLWFAIRVILFQKALKDQPTPEADTHTVNDSLNSLFNSYFCRNFFKIRFLKNRNVLYEEWNKDYLKALRQNEFLGLEMLSALKKEQSEGNPTAQSESSNFFRNSFNVLWFYKFHCLGTVANFLAILFFARHFCKINLLSIGLFLYIFIIMRNSGFRAVWTWSWVLCVVPTLVFIAGLTWLLLVPKQWELPGPNSSALTVLVQQALHFIRRNFGPKDESRNALTPLLTDFLKILTGNVLFLGTRAFIYFSSEVESAPDGPKASSKRERELECLSFNYHQTFKFFFAQFVKASRLCVLLLIAHNSIEQINVLNLAIVMVVFLNFAFPRPVSFDILRHLVLATFSIAFFARFLEQLFNSTDSFRMLFGLFFWDFFDFSFDSRQSVVKFANDNLHSNLAFVYLIFLLGNLIEESQPDQGIRHLRVRSRWLRVVKKYFEDLVSYLDLTLKRVKLFVLYFYTLGLYQTENEQKLNQLNFLLVMLLLGLHMIIIKKKGHLYNRRFILMLTLYLSYVLFAFCNTYFDHLVRIKQGQVSQASQIGTFLEHYAATHSCLRTTVVQILLAIMALRDILKHFRHQKNNRNYNPVEELQNKNKLYFALIRLLSVFMKEILLLSMVSQFLTNPNLFKLLYLCFYLKYFYSQFSTLKRILTDFQFEELAEAKIRFYKNSLLSRSPRSSDPGFDLHSSFFQQFDQRYYRLFTRKLFNEVYKKVNEHWVFTFVIIFVYLLVIFGFNSEGVVKDDRYMVLKYFLNWESSDAFMATEYRQTFIVLIVTIFEVYFVNTLQSKFTEEEEQLISSVPRMLLFRYTYLGCEDFRRNKSAPEDPKLNAQMKALFFELREVLELEKSPMGVRKESSLDQVANLSGPISENQKPILLSFINSQYQLGRLCLASLNAYKKTIVLPILLAMLTRHLSFFDLSFLSALTFFYSRNSFAQQIGQMNFVMISFCLTDFLFAYLIETSIVKHFRVLSFLKDLSVMANGSHRVFLTTLFLIIQYIALLKVFFLASVAVCKFLFDSMDKVDPQVYSGLHKRTLDGLVFYNVDFGNKFYRRFSTLQGLTKFFALSVGDFFGVIMLIFYYTKSSWTSFVLFLLLVGLKVFLVMDEQKPISHYIQPEFVKHFRWLSACNLLLLVSEKAILVRDGLELSLPHRLFFAFAVIFNFWIIDLCNSQSFQEERLGSEQYFNTFVRLLTLNKVYLKNEQKMVNHLKIALRKKELNGLLDPKSLTESSPFSGPEDEPVSLRDHHGQPSPLQAAPRVPGAHLAQSGHPPQEDHS